MPPAAQPSSPSDLVRVLLQPGLASTLSPAAWSALNLQARTTGLLGRLAHRLLALGPEALGTCPPAMLGHLQSAIRVNLAQQQEVLREARHIDHALASLNAPVVLLKGAAYAVANLPAAEGRVFSDVDIMVPRDRLAQAESLLTMHGWMSTEQSAYNQRYYRQWMHELPPMQHLQRMTVLDVHHRILPLTARMQARPELMFAQALPLPGTRNLHVLAPADMLLHSMTHLFVNDDMSHALRDLSDMDLLARHFASDSAFWPRLAERARELDIQRPLWHALYELQRIWFTPIPTAVLGQVARSGPKWPIDMAMRWVWRQTFGPLPTEVMQDGQRRQRSLALGALYLRGHWLRMPPLMLIRHLSIKALGLHRASKALPSDQARL
jgi:hypothetical protein